MTGLTSDWLKVVTAAGSVTSVIKGVGRDRMGAALTKDGKLEIWVGDLSYSGTIDEWHTVAVVAGSDLIGNLKQTVIGEGQGSLYQNPLPVEVRDWREKS
jgi:hypothetical protein